MSPCLGKVFKRTHCLTLIPGIHILFNYDLYKIEKKYKYLEHLIFKERFFLHSLKCLSLFICCCVRLDWVCNKVVLSNDNA